MTSRVILPKALVLQDECFGKNYLSFLDFTHNYEQASGIFVPCHLHFSVYISVIFLQKAIVYSNSAIYYLQDCVVKYIESL